MVRELGRARRGRPGAAGRRRAACCRRSTTWSAPASSPATSSRSRRSGSSRSAPGRSACCATPTSPTRAASVLKIRGTNDCGRGVEGSGFLYADDRLMTNAHVVAGVDDPRGDRRRDAVARRGRLLQPRHRRRGARGRHRRAAAPDFDQTGRAASDGVAILGYPQDGPYDVQPGRIRSEQRLRSPNIYGDGTVIREVYSLRGLVRPGNSGGPIVSSAGDVVGRGVRRVGDRPATPATPSPRSRSPAAQRRAGQHRRGLHRHCAASDRRPGASVSPGRRGQRRSGRSGRTGP